MYDKFEIFGCCLAALLFIGADESAVLAIVPRCWMIEVCARPTRFGQFWQKAIKLTRIRPQTTICKLCAIGLSEKRN
jgi:hypothetical protein